MRDAMVTVRLPRAIRSRLDTLARQESRSLSRQVERLLEEALRARATAAGGALLRTTRPLAGVLAGGPVPDLADFQSVRGAIGASLAREARRGRPRR